MASDTREGGEARGPRAPLVLAAVLTAGTGAADAISFLRLGNVFTSMMTGNLIQVGVAVGRGDAALAAHVLVAVAAFVAGVLASSRTVGPAAQGLPLWPRRVSVALAGELVALSCFLGAWAAAGGRPGGGEQLALLAVLALAMGMQSGAVRGIGIPNLSTTYLTGTLIGVLAAAATVGRVQWHSLMLLAALLAGASAGGLLVVLAPAAAPALPVGLLVLVLMAAQTSARNGRFRQARPERP